MTEVARIVAKIALMTFLVSSMLAVGLSLTPRAILASLSNARLVLTALALNFLLAPAFAVALTKLIPIERPHAIGLLLLSGAAGAPFLPKLVQDAHCDLGVAVALMTLLTAGTTLFLPFGLPLIIPDLQASPWSIARPLLIFMLTPLAVGMLMHGQGLLVLAAPILARLANTSALVLIILLIALYFRDLLGIVGSGAIAASVIFIAGLFVVGYLLGGSQVETKGALGLATAARNIGAALVPASQNFSDSRIILMVVCCTIVTLLMLLPTAAWLRLKRQRAMNSTL
jgi:BASS family bile acid:Na+ symporter